MADSDVDDLASQIGFRPSGGAAPAYAQPASTLAQTPAEDSGDPDVDALAKQIGFRPAEDVSSAQAFGRSFARGVAPAAAGIVGGAATGAAYGALGGPGGALAGLIAGGLGGFAGSYGAERAQSYALHEMPEDWQEAIGQSDRDERLGQEQHPYASFLGGLAPFALTLKPTVAPPKPNATNLERLLANPLAARALSGGIMGGVQTAQDAYGGQLDWRRSAIATGFGVVFANPNHLGEALENVGGRIGTFGRRPTPGAVPAPDEVPRAVAEAAGVPELSDLNEHVAGIAGSFPREEDIADNFTSHDLDRLTGLGGEHPDMTGEGLYGEEAPWEGRVSARPFEDSDEAPAHPFEAFDQGQEEDHPWTLADVWDMGLFGPGMTEEVADGGVHPDPTAQAQANEAAKTVAPRQIPDPDVEARRTEPELFSDYDRARNSVDVLRAELQRASEPMIEDVLAAEQRVTDLQAKLPKEGEYAGGRQNRQLRAELRDAQRQATEIRARRDAFAAGEATDTPQIAAMRAALLKADEGLRDISKQVAGARRMAAERVGAPVVDRAIVERAAAEPAPQPPGPIAVSGPTAVSAGVPAAASLPTLAEEATQVPATFEPIAPPATPVTTEPPAATPPAAPAPRAARERTPTTEPPAGATGPRTLDQQRATIADDVAQRMRQSGRPDDEARRWGEVAAEHYVARAQRAQGALGDAETLYRRSVQIDEAGGAREKRVGNNVVQGETARRAWPRIVRLFKDADASTIVHENGHVWLDELQHDAAREMATDAVKRDWETVSRWLKIKEGQPIPRAAHERFANSFTQYMREGVAPTARLAHAFERFKSWLTQIYKTVARLGEPIDDEVRGVFDRLLAEQPDYVTLSRERPTGDQMWNVHTGEAINAEAPDAEALADRMAVERLHAAPDSPEVAHEIEKASAQVEAQRAEANGSAADAGGENGAGGGGSRALEPGGGAAGDESGGVGVGGGASAQRVGGDAGAQSRPGVDAEQSGSRDRSGSEPFPLAPRSKPLNQPAGHWVGKDGNIRLENVQSEQDARAAVQEIVDQKNSTTEVYTDGQRIRDAEMLGLDPRSFTLDHFQQVFGGMHMLASKIEALVNMFDQQGQVFATLRAKAADTLTDEDVLAAAAAGDKVLMLSNMLSPITTEWGRAGRAFRRRGAEQSENNAEAAKMMTGKTLYQLKMELRLAKNLNSTAQINKWIRDGQQRSFGRMLQEFFVNNLISGPATHITYLGAAIMSHLNTLGPETLVASMVGQARAALGREGSSVYAGEAIAQWQELFRSAPKAAQAAIEAARSGLTTSLPGEAAHPQRVLQGDIDVSPDFAKRVDRWFLDQRMKTEPKDAVEAARRAREFEKLKDVEPLAPFGDDEESLIRISKNLMNADVAWGEAKGDLFGLMRGIKDGILANGALIKAGGDPNAPTVGLQFRPGQQIPDVRIKGVSLGITDVGTITNSPSRGVAVLHSLSRTFTYSTNINAQAYRAARNEGFTGTELAARTMYLRQNPTPEMMEAAHGAANQLALMGKGGAFANAMTRVFDTTVKLPLLGETQPLRFINPFIKVAANIMDQTLIHRTPVGLLAPSIREALMSKDNVVSDTARARMILGTGYAIGFGLLAMEENVTGSGPLDPDRRNMWTAAGYQPYSIRVGDMWYDLHRLGPLGLLFGIGADLYDVGHLAKEGEYAVAATMFTHAIAQNMLDESFLRGPAEAIQAVENPSEFGEHWVQGLATSFIPLSVMWGQINRATDPWSRQTRSVVSAMKAKLPGVSETLLPRVDLWGNDVPNEGSLGGLTAIYRREMSRDQVVIALNQAGVAIASPRKIISGVQLNDQQYHEFSVAAGKMTYQRLKEWVLSPDWRSMTADLKRQHVTEIVQQCRNAARGLLQMKYPALLTQAADVKANRFRERY